MDKSENSFFATQSQHHHNEPNSPLSKGETNVHKQS